MYPVITVLTPGARTSKNFAYSSKPKATASCGPFRVGIYQYVVSGEQYLYVQFLFREIPVHVYANKDQIQLWRSLVDEYVIEDRIPARKLNRFIVPFYEQFIYSKQLTKFLNAVFETGEESGADAARYQIRSSLGL